MQEKRGRQVHLKNSIFDQSNNVKLFGLFK